MNYEGVLYLSDYAVCNCTPHPIRFLDGTEVIEIPPSGMTLAATPKETMVCGKDGYVLVKTVFIPSKVGDAEVIECEERGMLPIGSIISAQAWAGRVVSLVPVEGYERKPPAEKLYRCDKFNIF